MAQGIVNFKYEVNVPNEFKGYKFIKVLGKGTYSLVVLAQNLSNGQLYAVKVFSKESLIQSSGVQQFQREVTTFSRLSHNNIVRLHEMVDDEKQIYLAMDYCSNRDLRSYILSHGRMDEDLAHLVFRRIVAAVNHLHHLNIAHRDLKPENILFDNLYNPKLADFGFSRDTSSNTLLTTQCGSPVYVAPEILSNKPYEGIKADIWSLGIVLYVIVVGKIPWTSTNQSQLYYQIQTCQFHVPNTLSQSLQQLITSLIDPVPKSRPSTDDILRHPWVVGSSSPNPQTISNQSKSNIPFSSRPVINYNCNKNEINNNNINNANNTNSNNTNDTNTNINNNDNTNNITDTNKTRVNSVNSINNNVNNNNLKISPFMINNDGDISVRSGSNTTIRRITRVPKSAIHLVSPVTFKDPV